MRALEREHGSDPRVQALLDETCRELAGDLPRLLESLLDDLIGEVEGSGNGDLLDRLSSLKNVIASMD